MISRVDLFYLPPTLFGVIDRLCRKCAFESWPDGRILAEAERVLEFVNESAQSQSGMIPWYECQALLPLERSFVCMPAGEHELFRRQRHHRWAEAAAVLFEMATIGRWSIEQFVAEARVLLARCRSELETPLESDWFSLPSRADASQPYSESAVGYNPNDFRPLKHDPPHRT